MRRLHTARKDDPDPASLQGFDSLLLEGDPLLPGPDAVASLRPFGRDLTDPALALAPGLPTDDPRFASATELANRGRRLEATQVLTQLIADQPHHTRARSSLARLLEQAGDHDGAVAQLTAALEVGPADADLWAQRGALHALVGRAAQAEDDLMAAVAADSSHATAYRYLGLTRLRLGRPREAARALREARRLAPDDGDVNLALGEALMADGQSDEALSVLQAGAEARPDDPRIWRAIARLLDRLERSEEALAMYRKARELGGPR